MNRMMKNAVCLVLLFALTVFCCAGAAEGTVVASGSCGTGVTWALDDAGTLTISGSGEMTSSPWLEYAEQIQSAVIKDGVTSIALCAFDGCENLASVSIPDSITAIHGGAFRGCFALITVDLPDGLGYIDEETFSGCKNLTSIALQIGRAHV